MDLVSCLPQQSNMHQAFYQLKLQTSEVLKTSEVYRMSENPEIYGLMIETPVGANPSV